MFTYQKRGAESACLLKEYMERRDAITSDDSLSNYTKAKLQKEELIPIRATQISKFEDLMTSVLQTTSNIGGLGAIHNMQAASLNNIIFEPDELLMSWNEYLPDEEKIIEGDLVKPTSVYIGESRFVCLDLRTVIESGEQFSVTVGFLSEFATNGLDAKVTFTWRYLGEGDWKEAKTVKIGNDESRQLYQFVDEENLLTEDFEYIMKAANLGSDVIQYPKRRSQTVVVV